jgi:hypothetical protein
MPGREEQRMARDRRPRDFLYEQRRFQSIFRSSAVSLWEEDISELRTALKRLSSRGIVDFGRYIGEHPEFLAEASPCTRRGTARSFWVRSAGRSTSGIRSRPRDSRPTSS